MPRRAIAKLPPLTPRQKEVYAHLCRKLRGPLIYGHARGLYLACYDALLELHGDEDAHPILSESLDGKTTPRAQRLLHALGVYSIQHLVDYDTLEFIRDAQMHFYYDELVGVEIARLKGKYQKIVRSIRCRVETAPTEPDANLV